MSKEVIAQYLADMEKDDFVFVHPTTTEGATVKEEVEAEAGDLSPAEELDDAPSVAEDMGGGEDEDPVFMLPESHGPEKGVLRIK